MTRYLLATLLALGLLHGAAQAGPVPTYRLAAASESELFSQGMRQAGEKAHADAVKSFSEVLKLNPKHSLALKFRADSYTELADYPAALADYDRLLADQAADPVGALIGRGEVYRRQNKLDQALADFDRALGLLAKQDATAQMAYLDPAHFGRARVYAAQGKTALARADFKLATANLIMAPKAYLDEYRQFEARILKAAQEQVKLAELKAAAQDFTAAKTALDACIRIEPQAFSCYVYRAQLQTRLGQFEPALLDLASALELNPKEPQLYFLRAVAYANTGKRDLAIADLRKALELKPDYKEASDGLKQLGVTP